MTRTSLLVILALFSAANPAYAMSVTDEVSHETILDQPDTVKGTVHESENNDIPDEEAEDDDGTEIDFDDMINGIDLSDDATEEEATEEEDEEPAPIIRISSGRSPFGMPPGMMSGPPPGIMQMMMQDMMKDMGAGPLGGGGGTMRIST